jgi:hypothetical protein
MATLQLKLLIGKLLLDFCSRVMREGYDEYDCKARSLVHDVEYLRDRYADRLRIETEKVASS